MNYETIDTDELLRLARQHDMNAAHELVGRVRQADYLLTSPDRAAKDFRIGAGTAAADTLRATADRVRRDLREMFRLSPIYKAARFAV